MAERIVSLVPGATETLFAAGLGDRVRAVSHACDHPPAVADRPRATRLRLDLDGLSSQAIDEAIREASEREEAIFQVLEEVLHHADPDLIVTQEACSVCGVTPVSVRGALSRIEPGKWPEIVSLHPHTLDDVLDDIEGLVERAGGNGDLGAHLRERVETIEGQVPDVDDRPRVAVLDWLDPPMVAGHWIPGMVERAGGQPVLIQGSQPSRYVDPDAIVRAEPDVLVLAPCGFDLARGRRAVEEIREHAWFEQIVKPPGCRIVLLDADGYTARPGPRLIDGLAALAHAIWPGRVQTPEPGTLEHVRAPS